MWQQLKINGKVMCKHSERLSVLRMYRTAIQSYILNRVRMVYIYVVIIIQIVINFKEFESFLYHLFLVYTPKVTHCLFTYTYANRLVSYIH